MNPSPALEAPLRKVRARMRGVQRARGLTLAATVAVGGLLALMAVDFLLGPLPTAWRWALTGAWLAAVLLAIRTGLAPLLRPIGLLQVARWLEQRHPEMQERLSTVLELSGSGDVSSQLLDSLATAAEADAVSVDAAVEVKSARTARRWTVPAVALVAIMALAFVVWPGETSRLLVRAVAPFSQVGNAAAGRFKIAPGNKELLIGDALKIDVAFDGKHQDPELWMELENGQKLSQPLTHDGDHFAYTIDPVHSGFRYRARARRAESDVFTITAWPRPELVGARATLDFPEYTGAPSQEIPLDRGIHAVTGTRVTIAGGVNTAIASAWLTVVGKRVADGTVESAAKGGRVSFSWTLPADGSGEAAITLKHRLGAETEASRFAITVAPDSPPEVVLLSPMERDLKVRRDEILMMRYQAIDDFGLAKVAVETEPQSLLAQSLPARIGRENPATYRGEAEVSMGALRSQFPGKNEFRLRVRAEDARLADAGGPGVGVSEWLTLHIEEGAETLARQELRQQDEGARKAVEEAMQAARESRERMDRQRGEIKNPELSDNAQKDLTEAAQRLSDAERKLAELAKKLNEGVHASKAEEVEKAAEMAAKARQELENSLLQDDPAQREAKLDSARDQASQTEQELEKLRQAMNQDRQKIEDLGRMMELARKQKELARQAAENLAKADTNRDDWQNRQRQVEEAIKQQLRERPETHSDALTAQAGQAKALAAKARQAAADQQSLAKGNSPEKIRRALAAEQAEIAAHAHEELAKAQESRSEIADQLPAATAAADAAKEELQASQPENSAEKAGENTPEQTSQSIPQSSEKAVGKTLGQNVGNAAENASKQTSETTAKAANLAKTAADAMKQAASTADPGTPENAAQGESLAELADRQQRVAETLDSLAKGETAEAARQFDSARAEAAKALASEIDRMPQFDNNGAMNDARNASSQGSEQATAAVEKSAEGKAAESAQHHDRSGKDFQQTAQALDRAAEDFAKAAAETKGRQADAQKAPVNPAALAEAFQQSSMAASEPQPAAAAEQAGNAAEALAEAAKAAMQGMQGKQPGQGKGRQAPGEPGQAPGEKPEEGFRAAEADPGVPPELAKLGISSDDWAKIQATLKSDIGGGEANGVPEEYRGLVKSYFESMSKSKK